MADRKMKFTLDFLAKTAGLKDAGDLLDRLGDELDDSVDGGKRLTAAMRLAADHIEADLAQTRAMAQRLGEALGPELSASMGSARLDQFAANLRQAGMSADQLDENIDDVADAVRRMDAASASVDNFDGSMRRAADTTDRTGSVVANFAGNAAQELPGVTSAMGPLNMAIGQFAEYAMEGGIGLKQFAGAAGGLAVVSAGLALLSHHMESAAEKERRIAERAAEVADALDEQATKTYELAAANATAEGSLDGLTLASVALNKAVTLTGDAGETLTESLGALGMSADQGLEAITRMKTGSREFIVELLRTSGAIKEDANGLVDWAEVYGEMIDRLDDPGELRGTTLLKGEALAVVEAIEALQDVAEETDLQQITNEFLDNKAAASEAGRSLVLLAEANTGLSRTVDALSVYNEFNRLLGESDAATRDAVLGTSEYSDSLDAARKGLDDFQAAQDAAREALQEHRDALLDAIDDTYNYESASIDLADSVADLAAKQAEVDAILADSSKTDAEKAAALRDLRRQQISTAEGALEAARAFAESKGATDGSITSARLQIEELRRQKVLFPELTGAIDGYIARLRAIPGVVNTSVQVNGAPNGTRLGAARVAAAADGRGSDVAGAPTSGRSTGGLNLTINVTPGGSGSPADYGAAVADAITRWWNDGGRAAWMAA